MMVCNDEMWMDENEAINLASCLVTTHGARARKACKLSLSASR